MPLDFDKLQGAKVTLEAGEITKALSNAAHISDEDVDELHARFVMIAQEQNRRKAIMDNVLFFMQLYKLLIL